MAEDSCSSASEDESVTENNEEPEVQRELVLLRVEHMDSKPQHDQRDLYYYGEPSLPVSSPMRPPAPRPRPATQPSEAREPPPYVRMNGAGACGSGNDPRMAGAEQLVSGSPQMWMEGDSDTEEFTKENIDIDFDVPKDMFTRAGFHYKSMDAASLLEAATASGQVAIIDSAALTLHALEAKAKDDPDLAGPMADPAQGDEPPTPRARAWHHESSVLEAAVHAALSPCCASHLLERSFGRKHWTTTVTGSEGYAFTQARRLARHDSIEFKTCERLAGSLATNGYGALVSKEIQTFVPLYAEGVYEVRREARASGSGTAPPGNLAVDPVYKGRLLDKMNELLARKDPGAPPYTKYTFNHGLHLLAMWSASVAEAKAAQDPVIAEFMSEYMGSGGPMLPHLHAIHALFAACLSATSRPAQFCARRGLDCTDRLQIMSFHTQLSMMDLVSGPSSDSARTRSALVGVRTVQHLQAKALAALEALAPRPGETAAQPAAAPQTRELVQAVQSMAAAMREAAMPPPMWGSQPDGN